MFQPPQKHLNDLFYVAKIIKESFPEIKAKIKLKNDFLEIILPSNLDPFKIEELRFVLQNKFKKKVKIILQKS